MLYLYGFGFEDPSQRQRNVSHGWDDEDSAALLIEAESAHQARDWGRQVAEAFLKWLYDDPTVSWAAGQYADWVKEKFDSESALALSKVSIGVMPDLSTISTHPASAPRRGALSAVPLTMERKRWWQFWRS